MQTTAEDMTKEINEAYGQLFRKKLYRHYPPPEEAKEETDHEATRAPGRRPNRAKPPVPRPAEPQVSRWTRIRRGWRALRLRRLFQWSAAVLGLAVLSAVAWSWWLERPLAALFTAPVGASGTGGAPPVTAATVPPVAVAAPASSGPAPTAPPVGTVLTTPASAVATPGRLWATSDHLLSLDSRPEARQPETEPYSNVEQDKLAQADKLIEELFEPGDSKARVKAVQGPPDEEGNAVFRYGSSLVYFREGRVRGWVNREPRLRVPWWDDTVMPTVERFSTGSSRAEVSRAQGPPDGYSIDRYLYGTSEVRFSGGRVSGWSLGDVALHAFDLPNLVPGRPRP